MAIKPKKKDKERKGKKSSKSDEKPVKKKSSEPKGDGYKEHRAGSRKGEIHEVYDEKGREAAMKRGEKLGLTEGTLKNWIQTWKREDGETTPRKKKSSSEKSSKSDKKSNKVDKKSEKIKNKKKKKKPVEDDDEEEDIEESDD